MMKAMMRKSHNVAMMHRIHRQHHIRTTRQQPLLMMVNYHNHILLNKVEHTSNDENTSNKISEMDALLFPTSKRTSGGGDTPTVIASAKENRQSPPPMNPNFTNQTNEEYEAQLTSIQEIQRKFEQEGFEERANEPETFGEPVVKVWILNPNHPNFTFWRKVVIVSVALTVGLISFWVGRGSSRQVLIGSSTAASDANEPPPLPDRSNTSLDRMMSDDVKKPLGSSTLPTTNIFEDREQQEKAVKELQRDILNMEKQIKRELNLSKAEAKQFRRDIREEAVKRVKEERAKIL